MNTADSQRLVQHIRRLAGDPPGMPSDSELLRRYLVARDEAAFTALVRRHGSMVFSVCQSVLRQRHDAEDAFQAAFLILAQKAGSIRRQEGLGGWLQRVAYRVALKARADHLRRQEREAKAACSPMDESSSDELSWGELRAILHAELAALPERFRAPLVLCYLEGLTQEEAARRLGWTAATVKGRLQRGRDKLRRRLERRGVTLTAALAAALTSQALAETAVRSSGLLTMANATTAATALARGFLRPLLPIKLAMLSAVLLSLGVVAGGMALRSPSEPRPLGSDPSPAKPAERKEEPRAAVDVHGDPLPEGAIARLGTVRFNHGEGLHALFFSSDGKMIISEGNGYIRLWDAGNGKERDHIRTDTTRFDDRTILLEDGKTILSLMQFQGRDVFTTWDLAQKKKIGTRTLPVPRMTSSFDHQNALSVDGKLAVLHVHDPAQAQVFDLTTGKNLYQLAKGDKEFLAVTFAGNDRIVSADREQRIDQKQRIDVWEARTGKLLRHFTHNAPIRYLLASQDGRWLAGLEQRPSPAGRRDQQQEVVYLWDMRTGTVKHSLRAKAKHWFTNVCFSPDSKTLLTSSRSHRDENEVVLWDPETGRRLFKFDDDCDINADVAAISPDGSRLAAGNRMGKFELWNLKNGHRLTSEDSRHTQIAEALLSPTGDRATIIGRKSISSWDVATGRRLHSFDLPRDSSHARCYSSDGRYAVTFRVEAGEFYILNILIWDIDAGKILHTLRFPLGDPQVSVSFAPDLSLLATWHPGKQTLIRLWDVRSGKLVRSFEEHKAGWPGKMHFTAEGKTLFVAGKQVAAYEVATGKELFSWRWIGWRPPVVSPDGTLIAATPLPGSVGRGNKEDAIALNAIALFDARTGKLLRRCNDPSPSTIDSKQLAFSADGQLLASSNGEIIHLWEVATSKLIHTFNSLQGQINAPKRRVTAAGSIIYTFNGFQGVINSLSFSRDGRRLASASSDSTVLIWDVTGQPAKASALTEAKLKECWNDLAEEDAGRAHRAVWTLIRAPRESVAFLKARLHPVKPVRREQIDRWIGDLDADTFEVRQKAAAELEKLGERAEPALRRALENKPTLEQRRRIEPMLAKLEAAIPSGNVLRSLRSVRVLEHIDTAEARRLLRELANGAEEAWLTRAAQAALTRMDRSPSKKTP